MWFFIHGNVFHRVVVAGFVAAHVVVRLYVVLMYSRHRKLVGGFHVFVFVIIDVIVIVIVSSADRNDLSEFL